MLKKKVSVQETRRILAVTGKEAFEAYRQEEEDLKAIAETLKVPQLKEVTKKVVSLQEQLHKLQKGNAELKEKAAIKEAEMRQKALEKKLQ